MNLCNEIYERDNDFGDSARGLQAPPEVHLGCPPLPRGFQHALQAIHKRKEPQRRSTGCEERFSVRGLLSTGNLLAYRMPVKPKIFLVKRAAADPQSDNAQEQLMIIASW